MSKGEEYTGNVTAITTKRRVGANFTELTTTVDKHVRHRAKVIQSHEMQAKKDFFQEQTEPMIHSGWGRVSTHADNRKIKTGERDGMRSWGGA